jgi:hypothetical protein
MKNNGATNRGLLLLLLLDELENGRGLPGFNSWVDNLIPPVQSYESHES